MVNIIFELYLKCGYFEYSEELSIAQECEYNSDIVRCVVHERAIGYMFSKQREFFSTIA